jgi:hypothetical protein
MDRHSKYVAEYQKLEDNNDNNLNAVVLQTTTIFKMTPYKKPLEKNFGQGAM